MPSVFLCHATPDKPRVRRIARELERNGVQVWLDEHAIKVGRSLFDTIQQGIERADFVVVALSKEAMSRAWVKKELRAALTLETERDADVILPVLLESVDVPLFLRDKKYADFRVGFRRGLSELLEAFSDRGRPGTPIDLETTRCSVVLDIQRLDGSLVRYRKEQIVRCRSGLVRSYIEAWSPDGKLTGFKVRPGKLLRTWKESGTVHVETEFPKPIRPGERATREFECTWIDSFTGPVEYWDQRQHHPSRNVEILVRFPRSRPPRAWSVQEREGSILRDSNHRARLMPMADKPTLRLFIRTPRLLHSYVLRWEW